VELREADSRALLTVSNGGAPVPVEEAARLLEPFQRLARRGDGPPGAGLGLSIVRSVAQAHGGQVDVRARPGGGLEVTVALPGVVSTARRSPSQASGGDRAGTSASSRS
jgi:signal transduction histidine kinase